MTHPSNETIPLNAELKEALKRVNDRIIDILQKEPVFYQLNDQRRQYQQKKYRKSAEPKRSNKDFRPLTYPTLSSDYFKKQTSLPPHVAQSLKAYRVDELATLSDIKRIRNYLIKQCHPDLIGDGEKSKALTQTVLKHYQILFNHFQNP